MNAFLSNSLINNYINFKSELKTSNENFIFIAVLQYFL